MRIPDPGPFGDTFFEASSRAIVSGDLVNNPLRGCAESVVTVFTHRALFFALAVPHLSSPCSCSVALEVLHRALVLFCFFEGAEGPQVPALASLLVFLP
jgi:hypothetical protein